MWLRVVDRPGATVFATLAATEAFSRSLISGVIPLEAYRLLHTARDVSFAYTAIGIVALLTSFAVPVIIRVVRRKWIFSAGCVFMVVSPLMLLAETAVPFLGAMQFRALAVVCVNIALNLYILDYIARRDFVTAEPRRLAFMGVAWFIGPALGIYLYKTYGLASVCVPSALFAVAALAYFWVLRMRDDPRVAPAKKRPPTPWANIRRYLAQPRMRLAWAIPFARSSYWAAFFVYPPLYIAKYGGDEMLSAAMLSAGQGLLFAAPLTGRIAKIIGMRRVIILSFIFTGSICLLVGISHPPPVVLAVMVFFASIGAMTLDALGNIPFLRSVHAYERSEMTSVFRTYIEISQLLPAAIYAVLLIYFPLTSVFITLGLLMLATAWLSTYLPRRF